MFREHINLSYTVGLSIIKELRLPAAAGVHIFTELHPQGTDVYSTAPKLTS